MKHFVLTVLLLLATRLVCPAHPVSLVHIDALVHRDGIEVKLTIMPEDFLLVYGLAANDQLRVATNDIAVCANKHKEYLLKGLVIRDTDGNRLEGKVTNVDLPIMPAEGVLLADLMAHSIVYRLEYSLTNPPTHLSFQQRFGGDAVAIPALVELAAIRDGLPPEPTVRVPGDESIITLSFDWNETSRTATRDFAEAKVREEEKRKQDMGISSYSATYTFLYIQNDEVRVEILMPLLALELWQTVTRTNADFIEVSEQAAARQVLESFFSSANELKIDGVIVKPRLDRLDFYGVDFKDFAIRAEPRRLSAWTARVGAILTYSTKGSPGHVELKWTLIRNEMPTTRAVVFAYDKGSRFTFSQRDSIFKWDNPGAPPLPPVTAISTGEKSREGVATSLLRNIYRAFDYHNESDIYDALARSVHGDLLAELYLKIRQSLVVQDQGGAVAHVQEVKVSKAEPGEGKNSPGFTERVTWQVEGTVEHWGHVHSRVNEYSAELDIQPAEGSWKITGLTVGRQSQVKSAVMLRKL